MRPPSAAHALIAVSDSAAASLFAVISILAQAELADIREIAPAPNVGLWIAFAFAAAVLLVGVFLFFRRKPKPAEQAPPETPQAKAGRRLEDLRDKTDLGNEAFAVRVSEVLRHYLEEALRIPAPEQTSEEFLRELRGKSWLTPELHGRLEEFVRLADLAKFARQPLDSDQRELLLDSALQAVEATEPKPETETVSAC